MAASRTDDWPENSVLVVETGRSRFAVAADCVQVRRNGIEFWSPTAFELWTEMVVAVDGACDGSRQEGSAVVVACEGDRHRGYTVSVLFLDLAPDSGAPWIPVSRTAWS